MSADSRISEWGYYHHTSIKKGRRYNHRSIADKNYVGAHISLSPGWAGLTPDLIAHQVRLSTIDYNLSYLTSRKFMNVPYFMTPVDWRCSSAPSSDPPSLVKEGQ